MLVGGLSGFAGILYVSLQRKANPYDLAALNLMLSPQWFVVPASWADMEPSSGQFLEFS